MKQCKHNGCGASNPDDARFCNTCGKPLKRPFGASRAWIAVLAATTLVMTVLWATTWAKLHQAQALLQTRDSTSQHLSLAYGQRLDSLQREYYQMDALKCSAERRFSDFQEMVGRSYPMIIDSIDIGNVNRVQQVQTDYGHPIRSEQTLYLQPRLYYRGIKQGHVTLYVKWYDPDGKLKLGENSPSGFSQKNDAYIYTESKTLNLKGWGGDDRGNWRSGNYRLEVWCNGMLLATKRFHIF